MLIIRCMEQLLDFMPTKPNPTGRLHSDPHAFRLEWTRMFASLAQLIMVGISKD